MTIRRKLVVWVVALFAVALVVAGSASVVVLRNQLIGEVDQILIERSSFIAEAIDLELEPIFGEWPTGARFPSSQDMAVVVFSESGEILYSEPSGRADQPDPPPDVDQLAAGPSGPLHDQVQQIDAEGGDGPTYRALTIEVDPDGAYAVLAIPLDAVESTVSITALILLAAGSASVVVLGGLVWWLIRTGLRPVDDMIHTAERIAEGDLSHRVDNSDTGTEIGQLAVALNKMLSQIETAVDAKTESEERMRRFLSDASHELRTPLTSIRGYAELYHRGAASPEDIDRAFTRIEHEATRMSDLVDDLLLLARLDQRRPIAAESVDLIRVVSEAIDAARTVDPQRPIDLSFGSSNVLVVGDGARLRQVMDNLLANVRQHTPPETPAAVAVEADDRHVTVRVADSGPGLTEDQANKACDRFYQAHPERAIGGNGLGLSIVDAIIEAHQGSMRIETAPGRGLAVSIQLPRQAASPTPPESTST